MYPERVRLFESTFTSLTEPIKITLKILIADIRRHNLIAYSDYIVIVFHLGKKRSDLFPHKAPFSAYEHVSRK